MKTNELSGVLLDQWVGKAEEKRLLQSKGTTTQRLGFDPRYSSSWAIGGPIIQREGIQLSVSYYFSDPGGSGFTWFAETWTNPPARGSADDEPLVAAMRAYVALKFGDEIPDNHEAAKSATERKV